MSTHSRRRSSLSGDPGSDSDSYSIPGTPVLGELVGPYDHWWLSEHGVSYPAMTIQQLEDQATDHTSGNRLTVTSESSRRQVILQLLSDATFETRHAVSESLLSDASHHTTSLESLLSSMEDTQLKMQQAHPDQEHVYRCKKYPAQTMHKLLNNRDLEFGDIVHPHPHDWLIVPTWLKVKQLRGERSEKEVTDLNRDFRAKFDHGVNKLTEQLQAAGKGEDCACQRWYTYPELEHLIGLEIVCEVQIDAIVFKCLAHFYDTKVKELPSRIGGILSCTELKERNKHLYGHPA